jgi:stearoyl-CoA desaturase (delta-9 desaturase)
MFFINSLAHTWGSKTYAKELTAVDNFILAFLHFLRRATITIITHFPNDYRNGISWYHFDPTKWLIWVPSKSFHLAKNLRSKDGLIVRANLIQKDLKMVDGNTSKRKLPDMHASWDKIQAERFEHVACRFWAEKSMNSTDSSISTENYSLIKNQKLLARLKKGECLSIQKELQKSWKLWKEMVDRFDHQYVLIEH